MDAVKIPICKSFNVLNSQKQVTYPTMLSLHSMITRCKQLLAANICLSDCLQLEKFSCKLHRKVSVTDILLMTPGRYQ